MAAFAFTRPGGIWVDDSDVEASELASLDLKSTKALNAAEGGSWAPSSPIILGGSGLRMDGPFSTYGTATLNAGLNVAAGGAIVHDGLEVIGGNFVCTAPIVTLVATADAQVLAQGNLRLQAATVEVVGPATFSNDATFYGIARFKAPLPLDVPAFAVEIDQSLKVTGGIRNLGYSILEDTVLIGRGDGTGGGAIAFAPIQFLANGRITDRPTVLQEAISSSFSPITTQWVHVPAGMVVYGPGGSIGGIVCTINDSGCKDGDAIGFTNRGLLRLGIVTSGGGSIIQIEPEHWASCKRILGSWVAIMHGSFKRLYDDYSAP